MSLWWSFGLTFVGLIGLFLVYRAPQSVWGPVVGVSVQSLWIAYAVVTHQWWFILSAVGYGAVNVYGWRKRRRPRGIKLRVTKVGPDGIPVPGTSKMTFVTDATINFGLSPVSESDAPEVRVVPRGMTVDEYANTQPPVDNGGRGILYLPEEVTNDGH